VAGKVSVSGTVLEVLPRALYRVGIEGGREVTAHAGSGTSRNFIRLLVGDRVTVELSPRDMTRGRVVKKL
jgi:translation initiation factor IF-1